MPDRELVTGDVVETDLGDEGTVVEITTGDDGTRIAFVQHTADRPANPGGESRWAINKLSLAE